MHNHMEGRAGSFPIPLYSIFLGCSSSEHLALNLNPDQSFLKPLTGHNYNAGY